MQDFHKDSTICYSQQELRVISFKLIEGNECDTLLKISNKQLDYSDSIILSQKDIITKQLSKLNIKDTIIKLQYNKLNHVINNLSSSQSKLKWTKIGWAITTSIMGSLCLYLFFR
jgi:hypothetical protein